jgi:hypothetical protein
LVEHLIEVLSNSQWQAKIARSERALRRQATEASGKKLPPEVPCQCGCKTPVPAGRSFVNRDHQKLWMSLGGASNLAHRRHDK